MPAALKRSILIPLMICLVALIALSSGGVLWLEHRNINNEMTRRHAQVLKDFEMVSEATGDHLDVLAPRLAENQVLLNAFVKRDIRALSAEAEEFYDVFSATESLATLDILDDKGLTIYRAEEPEQYSDSPVHPVAMQALKDRQSHTSLEIDSHGCFVIMHAWPWVVDGKLMGCIVLGQEMQDEIVEVHESQGVDCLLFLDKSHLTEEQWKDSPRHNTNNPWNRYERHLLVGHTDHPDMLFLADQINKNGIQAVASRGRITTQINDQVYDIVSDPITDDSGNHLGLSFMIFDTTLMRHEATVATYWVVGCALLISLAVAGMFTARIATIERSMAQAKSAVEYEHQQRLVASSVADVLLDTVPCGVFHKDLDGRYLRCNGTFAQMIDVPPDKVLGKTVSDILDAQQAEMFATADRQLIEYGQVQSFECQLMDRIGQMRDAYVSKSAVRDPDGKITGIIGVMMDITARKQAEHAIAEAMRFARGALDALPVRLAVLDEAGVILAANQTWHKWAATRESGTETLAEESNFLHACDRTEALPIESAAAIAAGIRSVIGGSQGQFHMECSFGTPEDEQWSVVRVVRFTGNGPIRLLLAIEDVTDYHQAMVTREQYAVELLVAKEQVESKAQELVNRTSQLETARLASENASRGKSQFLANMSHEVRSPLTPILGYVDMLSQDDLPLPQRHEYLDIIRRHARHLLQILEDVMDIARIEAGRMEPERRECSVAYILDQLLQSMRPQSEQHGLKLELKIRQGFPSKIRSDAGRIQQIVTNLLANAIRASESGLITIDVGMDQAEAGGSNFSARMRIAVIDQGCGIPANMLPEVFEPFTQVQSGLKRSHEGCGLGLALGRRLARLLGGDIEAQSVVGRGSTFSFTFATGFYGQATMITTLEQLHQAAVEYAEIVARPPEPLPTLGGTILLVEDSLDNQSLVAHRLREHGATVVVAGNGELAINIALTRDNRIDAVLMDMQMPVMDGLEATQRLRSKGFERPIIALTAHSAGEHRQQCLSAGCNGFINKPVNVDELIRTLAGVLTKQPPSAVA